jgi:hypothetical protein
MIALPPVCDLMDAVHRITNPAVWCTPSIADRLAGTVPWAVCTSPPPLDGASWLVAVGGGTLIDQAKVTRLAHPQVRLAALPTLWGSGAEASPIAVLTVDGKKVIRHGAEVLPDLVIREPSFAAAAPAALRLNASGDAWSHALEGFLSPLGSDQTRADLAAVIQRMIQLTIDDATTWLDVSARACAGQATTSVGLVHGIAHVLEGPFGRGHARLCSLYLLPVMVLNRSNSLRWPLFAQHGLDEDRIFRALRGFFDAELYSHALPLLRERWGDVLRDPCTRTNCGLVRPTDIGFFESFTP